MEQMEMLRAKLKALWEIHEKLKPGFEQEFVRSNLNKNFYSVKVVKIIEDLFAMYVKVEKPDNENNNSVVRHGRVAAYKSSSGWQMYIDGKAFGFTITKRDAEIIVPFLGRDIDVLEKILLQPKPVIPAEREGEG